MRRMWLFWVQKVLSFVTLATQPTWSTMEPPRPEIMVVPELPLVEPKFESPLERMKRVRWGYPWRMMFYDTCFTVTQKEYTESGGRSCMNQEHCGPLAYAPLCGPGCAVCVVDHPGDIAMTNDELCCFSFVYPAAFIALILISILCIPYNVFAFVLTLIFVVVFLSFVAPLSAPPMLRARLACLYTRPWDGWWRRRALGACSHGGHPQCSDNVPNSCDKLSTTSSGKFSCSSSVKM